ncbi:MAG: acyl-CoA carboxylase subunit beta, partial [Deltaproteobacteria bacterium]|nr:acyl-CoA carboxylase subunit beta [Deltaproteobacteria bacterium]
MGDRDKILAKVQELEDKKKQLRRGGGPKAIEKQHQAGKLTARERIDKFYDPDTFMEIDMFADCLGREFGMAGKSIPGDGIVIGHGLVEGRPVAAFFADYTSMAGTFGEMHGRKMNKIIEFAINKKMPVVGVNDCAGARLQENMGPLSQYGRLFYLNSIGSGVVPQISLLHGYVAGGQAYSPGLMDFLFMVKDMGYTFIAGPPLVKAMLSEDISADELGGYKVHSTTSGVCHVVAEDEMDSFTKCRKLLSYLPSSNLDMPPYDDTGDPADRVSEKIYDIIPADRWRPYDMKKIIKEIVDNGEFFEIHKDYFKEMVICFARLGGHSVGIVANNPMYRGGVITTQAAEKAARFKIFCDAFNIPIINLIDTPAYLIGSQQEKLGIIYRGAKLLYATSCATVPQISVYIGKAYAGGYLTMGSKDFDVDLVYAWPTADLGLVGPKG